MPDIDINVNDQQNTVNVSAGIFPSLLVTVDHAENTVSVAIEKQTPVVDVSVIATGPVGPQGADGAAATIAVGTVTTGDPGDPVSVTNSGTSSAAVLNFTIPKGDTGADGATGDSGVYYGTTTPTDPDIKVWIDPSGTQDVGFVPAGGTAGQMLQKKSSTDYDTEWATVTIPTKVSDLTNDSGFITSYTETDPVFSASAASGISSSDISSWNGKSDFSGSYTDLTNKPTIPTKTSDLDNDSGFLTTAVTSFNGNTGAVTYTAPVTSVNGNTGAVTLTASDVGALPDNYTPPSEIFWATYGTTTNAKLEDCWQNNIPCFMKKDSVVHRLAYRVNASCHVFEAVYGTTEYCFQCESDVWYSFGVSLASTNSPTFTGTPKAPTATTGTDTTQIATTAFVQQEIGGIAIPSKVSDLQNDSGFISSYTETDPTVPSWAKAGTKPSYTASEVGAIAAPASPSSGDFLVYDGSKWDAMTMAEWQGGNY